MDERMERKCCSLHPRGRVPGGLVMLAPAAEDEAAIAQSAAIKELNGELSFKNCVF